MIEPVRIVPLSESAITVEFGDTITFENNRKAIALANELNREPFAGMIEAVPAYTSTTIYYDLFLFKQANSDRSANSTIDEIIRQRLAGLFLPDDTECETVVIEFEIDTGEFDLRHVAEATRLSVTEVIRIFTSVEYRVFMLGFLPGFAYLGKLDERLVLPRREIPRQRVPAGSVAIAGRQAGVYPLDSPGGWHIIGQTSRQMFTPEANNITALRAGMRIRFEAIS